MDSSDLKYYSIYVNNEIDYSQNDWRVFWKRD